MAGPAAAGSAWGEVMLPLAPVLGERNNSDFSFLGFALS